MNILIYVHSFSPRAGGAQVYAAMLARGLVSTGHSVRVVTESRIGEACDGELPFAVVRHPNLRTLWRLVGEAHVVQLTGPVLLPMLLALGRGKPTVIEHHGYQAACPNGLLLYEPTKSPCPGHFMAHRFGECLRCNAAVVGWLASLRMLLLTFPRRWLARWVSLNAPITHHVRERLRLPQSQVIYYGVPEPPLAEQAAAHLSTAPCFAYVGRLVSEKGLPLLVEAVARLKMRGRNVRLKFVGDGPERGHLEALAEAKGLHGSVTFTGFLLGGALEEATRDLTALVMPSIWEETAGLAAMEQMIRGRVVIASDIGGLSEVVGDAGLKFPAGDVEALAECLERVLDHPELPAALARRARERAEKMFKQERMVEEHLAAYVSLW